MEPLTCMTTSTADAVDAAPQGVTLALYVNEHPVRWALFSQDPHQFPQESTSRGVTRRSRGGSNVQSSQINKTGGLQLCKCLSNVRQASIGESRGGSHLYLSLCNVSQAYIRAEPERKAQNLRAVYVLETRYALESGAHVLDFSSF